MRQRYGDRGVSPVIAVILMVAITVILAAVIGSFVLDIGGSLNEGPPNTQFDFEQNNVSVLMADSASNPVTPEYRVVNITHVGGEQIDRPNLRVTVNGEQAYAVFDRRRGNDEWKVSMPFERFAKKDEPLTASGKTTILAHVAESKAPSASDDWSPQTISQRHYGSNNGDSSTLDIRMGGFASNYPGSSGVYGPTGIQLSPGDTVRVVWKSGGGKSSVLAEYEVIDDT